jgi:hypothetical protein
MRSLNVLILGVLAAQSIVFGSANAASVPDDVLEQARAYAKTHRSEKPLPGKTLVEEYASGFFVGFIHGGEFFGSDAFGTAYAKGAARWKEGPDAQQRTFAGYGYQRIEWTGLWTTGFETSRFEPDGQPGLTAWLDFLAGSEAALPKTDPGPRFRKLRLRLTGYLSPRGSYGHLGMHGRELFATSVQVLGN